MLIILVFLALTSSCFGQSWSPMVGSMKHVSIGKAGVWGVDSADLIYYREVMYPDNVTYIGSNDFTGTYQASSSTGTSWTHVAGKLKQLDVGTDIVVGVNNNSELLYRKDITGENPTGSEWVKLEDGVKHVTVSPHGAIWAIYLDGSIFLRYGINSENPAGIHWMKHSSSLTQISAGPSGVWVVDANDDIFYREGTYGGNITMGSGWTQVEGKLAYITSGSGVVLGVNREKQILLRTDIREGNPTGDEWVPLDGKLDMVEEYNGTMWGASGE